MCVVVCNYQTGNGGAVMAIVGKLSTADLALLVGDCLDIRIADNPVDARGKPKKFPLNVYHPAVGYIFFQTPQGQKFLEARLNSDFKKSQEVIEPVGKHEEEEPEKVARVLSGVAEKTGADLVGSVKTTPKKSWLDEI